MLITLPCQMSVCVCLCVSFCMYVCGGGLTHRPNNEKAEVKVLIKGSIRNTRLSQMLLLDFFA